MNELIIAAKTLKKAIKYTQYLCGNTDDMEYKGLGIKKKPLPHLEHGTTVISVIAFHIYIPSLCEYLYGLRVTNFTNAKAVESHRWHPIITQDQKQKVCDLIHEAVSLQIAKEKAEKIAKDKKDANAITSFLDKVSLDENT